jgi:hypothetical protein
VIEKPFIGPEPMKKRIIAAINVVIFASKIVVLDFVYPESNAIIELFSVYFIARLITAYYVIKNKHKEKLI